MPTKLSELADAERSRFRITGVQAIELRNSAGQSLVRVQTDAGLFGIGEAGATGPQTRAELRWLERVLLGADPLAIDRLYHEMLGLQHTYRARLSVVSGVDIALWDLAGKILGLPVCEMLSGPWRDEIELYYGGAPPDWTDQSAMTAWFDAFREHPHGYKTLKFGFDPMLYAALPGDLYVDCRPNQSLKASHLELIADGFAKMREVMGPDLDWIAHSHNDWSLPAALGLCRAAADARPLWMEDLLPVWYSDAYRQLREASPVPICTGEKLEGVRDFLPFLQNSAIDVVHPDLCWVGGISGGRKLAELADLQSIPVATHNCGSLVQNLACAHFGASVRNFTMSETRLYERDYIARMGDLELDVRNGMMPVPRSPGLGVELQADVLRAELADGEPFWD